MTLFRPAIVFLSFGSVFTLFSNAQTQPYEGFSFGPNAVIGLPYSVIRETEETQTLNDGTHITSKHQARLYRDSAGRVRFEIFAPTDRNPEQQTPEIVKIIDPTRNLEYTLNPPTHTAHYESISLRESPPPPVTSAPAPPDNPDKVDDYVSKLRASKTETTSEDLGTQMMEGTLVKGERTTWTVPIYSEGNDKPIVQVDEVWTSTDLGLTILSKHSDPRTGETVMRVISLDQTEPDPTLFQVPPDYTVGDPTKK
jgi:hypothetical protein